MKTVLKPCNVADAIQNAMNGQQTFILIEITEDTAVIDLHRAHGFMTAVPADEPKPEPKAEPKPQPKAQPKKQTPKPAVKKQPALDHGKIMALHKAGWPVAKIADEMGCTAQAIRYHITEAANESAKDPQP